MDCCDDKSCEVEALQKRHSRVLIAVLASNAAMFLVEAVAGYLAGSSALLGDSVDMLGDAMAYGISLYVLGKGARWNAGAALFKGILMAVLGTAVLGTAVHNALAPGLPSAGAMGAIGFLALAANLVCLGLLWKSRGDDLNMHSDWLCSRNDILENFGILASAFLVALTKSRWPDVILGAAIAVFILHSALGVIRRARATLRGSGIPETAFPR